MPSCKLPDRKAWLLQVELDASDADADVRPPEYMNPLTGQASVRSRDGAAPTSPAPAVSSIDGAEQPTAGSTEQRSRGIFPWWKRAEDGKQQGEGSTDAAEDASGSPEQDQPQEQAAEAQKGRGWLSGALAWLSSWRGGGGDDERRGSESTKQVVVDEVIVPKDLPLDAIAAEVQVRRGCPREYCNLCWSGALQAASWRYC